MPVHSPEEKAMTQQGLVVHFDPEILGSTHVFVGTRVPLRNLIDYLERSYDLDQLLDDFPSVSRGQAVAALEAAHEVLTSRARATLRATAAKARSNTLVDLVPLVPHIRQAIPGLQPGQILRIGN
jgi:uncharacterized protein (DUF433 family)